MTKAKTPAPKTFTAFVVWTERNEAGELVTMNKVQDVTDEVNEGADREELADRLYWKHVHGRAGFVEVVGGGVREE